MQPALLLYAAFVTFQANHGLPAGAPQDRSTPPEGERDPGGRHAEHAGEIQICKDGNAARPPSRDPVLGAKTVAENIDLARTATQSRAWQHAALLWTQVLEQSPRQLQAYVGAGNALRESGSYDEAERILGIAVEYFPDKDQVAVARGWAANARRDWNVAIQRWQDVCARFPYHQQGYNGMAQALRGAGRLADLEAFFVAALARLEADEIALPRPERLLDAKLAIARLRSDWPSLQLYARQIVTRDAAPAAAVHLALAQASWHLGEAEAAEAAALLALAADPKSPEAHLLLARIVTSRGDGEAALSCYQNLAALNPNTPHWRLKHLQLLSWHGLTDQAAREAAELLARWPDDPMVRTFLRNFGLAAGLVPGIKTPRRDLGTADPDFAEHDVLQALYDRAPALPASARAIIAAEPERDVLIAGGARADTALLIFAGTNDGIAMPLPIFDRYLAPLDLTPVYFRDFNRLRYLSGIRSVSDNYQGTIDWLRKMLRDQGITRLFTLGNCVGGFAAIRYGIELGAERIVAFHAPTCSMDSALAQIEQGKNFSRKRLAARVPAELTDLKPFLDERRSSARIELFYDTENKLDQAHAERLGYLPEVHLNPQSHAGPGPGGGDMLRRLILSKENFSLWLAGVLAVQTLPAAQAPQPLPA